MTRLERQVHTFPASDHVLRRYLTLFYSFALGLAFLLGISACSPRETQALVIATITPPDQVLPNTPPVLFGTQALAKSSPTPLPAIPATPNEQALSPLGITSDELRGLQVTVWHPWIGADGASFQAILDEFNRANKWGITATARGYEDYGSLDEAIEAGLASGNLPNILVDYGYQAHQWEADGLITDLTPYLDDPVWGLSSHDQADFYPGFWSEDLVSSGSKPKSRQLGIPYYRSAYMIFYNHSWAQVLGFPEPPTTPQAFRTQACAAANYIEKSEDKSMLGQGGWLISTDPGDLLGWIYAFGGTITNTSGTGYTFDTLETRQALTFLKGMQESGCAWADDTLDRQSALANRQALFIVSSLFDISAQQAAMIQAGSMDDWMVIPFPSDTLPVVDSYGPSLLVTHSTPESQLASWLVVEWLVYPPNQAKFVQQLQAYPTRQSTLSYFIQSEQSAIQWTQALGYIAGARGEPNLPSWGVMRWALSDAASQLFSLQYKSDQVPSLVNELDRLAKEVMNQGQ
jgi:multiple sugar transport system substrate-binding protein